MKKKLFLQACLLAVAVIPSIAALELLHFLPGIPRNTPFWNIGKVWFSQYTYDPYTGYSLIKNIRDHYLKVNTDYLGNRSTSLPYDPKKQSILLIGDSTTFGWLASDQETFAYKLSQAKEFRCYNVVNLGVPSYSLGQISNVIKYKAPQYKPVLIATSILWPWKAFNDSFYGPNPDKSWRSVDTVYFRSVIPDRTSYFRPYIPGTYALSNLSNLTKLAIATSKSVISYRKPVSTHSATSPKPGQFVIRPGISDFNMTLSQELTYANTHVVDLQNAFAHLKETTPGVITLSYIHPYSYTLLGEYERMGKPGSKYIESNLPAFNFKHILNATYRGNTPLKQIYIDSTHLTPFGHTLWAETLRKMIVQQLSEHKLNCPQ